jgi:hypothetical protein
MIARIVILKAIHHQIEQDGVMLGIFSPQAARKLVQTLESKWPDAASDCLRSVSVRTDRSGGPALEAILDEGEAIKATCYFDNYYTFATEPEAASRMYRDTLDIAEIAKRKSEGSDYQDLTLIKGSQLVSPQGEPGRKSSRLTEAEASGIRMKVLSKVRQEATSASEPLPLSAKERAFFQDRLESALGVAFSRGILKTF